MSNCERYNSDVNHQNEVYSFRISLSVLTILIQLEGRVSQIHEQVLSKYYLPYRLQALQMIAFKVLPLKFLIDELESNLVLLVFRGVQDELTQGTMHAFILFIFMSRRLPFMLYFRSPI